MNNLNLEYELNNRLDKYKCDDLAHKIIQDTNLKQDLLTCIIHPNTVISKSAAWVLSHVHNFNKTYFKDDLELLIRLTCDIELNTILRCVLRLLQDYTIPVELQGILITRCFGLLTNHQTPVAIKAFAMTIVANHSQLYPDLKPELKLVIEDLLLNPTPGLLSRGSKILKLIS